MPKNVHYNCTKTSPKSINKRKTMHFEEVWEANQVHLKNFITVKVPSQEVPDILQIVSIEFYNQLLKGDDIEHPKKWLFQVTRNVISDYYKKKSRTAESELEFANNVPSDYKNCACDIMELAAEAFLPEKFSKPLILSDIYNIPQKEIAKQLGLSYENCKSIIQRARKKMKEEIEKYAHLTYNKQGQVVGCTLKDGKNMPHKILEKINNLGLED